MFDFKSNEEMQLVQMHNQANVGKHFAKPAPIRGRATSNTPYHWGLLGRMLMALGVLS